MKKLVLLFAVVGAVACVSCSSKANTEAPKTDSVAAPAPAAVDTAAAAVDTAAATPAK